MDSLVRCRSFNSFFSKQIISVYSDSGRPLVYFSTAFFIGLLATSFASEQDFYRTIVGVWGRNNGTLTYIGLLILFLSLASMKSSTSSYFLIKSLVGLGFFGATYGLLQNSGNDPITWENPGNKIILTLGNSDFASAFLALSGIATLTLILNPKSGNSKRFFLVCLYLIELFLTHKSEAIQGFLVLIIGSLILIGLRLSTSPNRKFRNMSLVWWAFLVSGGIFGTLGLFGSGPMSHFLAPSVRSLQDRLYHWLAALNMMRDHLLFGVGIDSFGDFYRRYRVIEAIELRGTASSSTNNAHNAIMQIGATGGLVLLIPYLLLLAFIAYRAFKALRNFEDKAVVAGIFSIWIAFQIQALVSIDQIGLVVWGWASGGCLVALSYISLKAKPDKNSLKALKSKSAPNIGVKKFAIPILVIFGFTPSIILSSSLWNELQLRNQIVSLLSSPTADTVKVNSDEVLRLALNSEQPELRLQALQYLLKVGSNNHALELAQKTANEFPESFDAWDAVARIYEGLGEKQKAVVFREKTIKLDPLNDEIRKILADDLAAS